MLALRRRNYAFTQTLLKYGANVETKDGDGLSTLDYSGELSKQIA